MRSNKGIWLLGFALGFLGRKTVKNIAKKCMEVSNNTTFIVFIWFAVEKRDSKAKWCGK